MFLALLIACQDPFGADRHDLLGFRIAAVEAGREENGLRPRAAMVVDGHLWSDEPVELRWFAMESSEELEFLEAAEEPDALGPRPHLGSVKVLGLIARHGGQEARAFLEVVEGDPPELVGLRAQEVRVGSLPEEMIAENRAERPLGASSWSAAPGEALRLSAESEPGPVVRWMATAGTFYEVDELSTDWVAARQIADDEEEWQTNEPLNPGPVAGIALAVEEGLTSFRLFSLAVGDVQGVRLGDVLVPVDGPIPELATRGRLVADDASPIGLRLAEVWSEETPVADPWCTAQVTGPFDPEWLLDQRCTREQLDGAVVWLAP